MYLKRCLIAITIVDPSHFLSSIKKPIGFFSKFSIFFFSLQRLLLSQRLNKTDKRHEKRKETLYPRVQRMDTGGVQTSTSTTNGWRQIYLVALTREVFPLRYLMGSTLFSQHSIYDIIYKYMYVWT